MDDLDIEENKDDKNARRNEAEEFAAQDVVRNKLSNECSPVQNESKPRSSTDSERTMSQRLEVLSTDLRKDFIFLSTSDQERTLGFTNTKWLAESSARNIVACGDVFMFEKSNLFWKTSEFVERVLVVYTDLIVIGRQPSNAAEIRSSLNDPSTADIFAGMPDNDLMESFLIAEVVVDLKTSKFRRTSLTTPSSVEAFNEDLGLDDLELRNICFEIVSPARSYLISAVNANEGAAKFVLDNKTLFLTTQWEESIVDALYTLHKSLRPEHENDSSWLHQIILGTLHSHVITGNYNVLEKALTGKGSEKAPYCGIDNVDDDGFTALHHACFRRSNIAVATLLNAGADFTKTTVKGRNTPCHICAQRLDSNSLSLILSQTQPRRPDPNALNENGNTPMTVAIMNGRAPGGTRNSSLLRQCVSSLQAWGGKLHVPYSPHPIHTLSAEWCHDELDIIFPICDCSFPITGNGIDGYSQSLGALYDYPLHTCVTQLRKKIAQIGKVSRVFSSRRVGEIAK